MILAGEIDAALQAHKYLRSADSDGIEIKVNEGVVTLCGHVGTTAARGAAESAVRGVPGIAQVENQLVADDKLTMTVAQVLGNDERMRRELMSVNTQHGFVYLTGSASSAAIRLLAAQLAASVPQTRGVVNRIKAPGVKVDELEEQIVQPTIDQTIYTRNGEVGHVRQVIIHPHNRRVRAVVVGTHSNTHLGINAIPLDGQPIHPERRHLIAIDDLNCAPSGALFLKRHDGKLTDFVDFTTQSVSPPPADWQPPYPYRLADIQFSRS